MRGRVIFTPAQIQYAKMSVGLASLVPFRPKFTLKCPLDLFLLWTLLMT